MDSGSVQQKLRVVFEKSQERQHNSTKLAEDLGFFFKEVIFFQLGSVCCTKVKLMQALSYDYHMGKDCNITFIVLRETENNSFHLQRWMSYRLLLKKMT